LSAVAVALAVVDTRVFVIAVELAFLVVIPEGDLRCLCRCNATLSTLSFPPRDEDKTLQYRHSQMTDLISFVRPLIYFLRFRPKNLMSTPKTI
jgi:hypothetical protein